MNFKGISKIFTTENQQQYETIGAFWDDLAKKYGRENLRGLGYNWTENTIEYVIGLKDGEIENCNCEVSLPDCGWIIENGRTENLGEIYKKIYQDGNLKFEIETFDDNGNCEIRYYR